METYNPKLFIGTTFIDYNSYLIFDQSIVSAYDLLESQKTTIINHVFCFLLIGFSSFKNFIAHHALKKKISHYSKGSPAHLDLKEHTKLIFLKKKKNWILFY